MIAFNAEYAGGEITPDRSEIEDAGWFTIDNLPRLPGKISISRRLIDALISELVERKARGEGRGSSSSNQLSQDVR